MFARLFQGFVALMLRLSSTLSYESLPCTRRGLLCPTLFILHLAEDTGYVVPCGQLYRVPLAYFKHGINMYCVPGVRLMPSVFEGLSRHPAGCSVLLF
jgi:hypothetical protein